MPGAFGSSFHRAGPARSYRRRRYAFVFVCQRGEIEIESVLLAASLKKFVRCRHELIACIHTPDVWGQPEPATLDFFRRLGVRTEVVQNDVGPDFPHAVKFSCMRVNAFADKVVYLDSDILCMAPFEDEPRFTMPLNLKPADLHRSTLTPEKWRAACGLAGLAAPDRRMRSTLSGEDGPPYFNGGVVAFERGINMGDAWQEAAVLLRSDPGIMEATGSSDQLSLAIAVHRLGVAYDLLNERYNYPLHLRPLKNQPPPLFCHYHWPHVIRREPQANNLVLELASEHREIASLVAASPAWAPLLRPYAIRPRLRSWLVAKEVTFEGPELVLTGIARSGTSHLAGLIRRYGNCVMVDEPHEIIESVAEDRVPWRAAIYYRDQRRRILDREPMADRVAGGPGEGSHLPRLDAADFILGTKNSSACIPRLGDLRRALPDARFVACVRNPLDTIASWKGSFQHLSAADVNPHDPFLSDEDRAKLAHMAGIADLAERRARLWTFFAESLLKQRDRLILVRYEDLTRNPNPILRRILKGWRAGRPTAPIVPAETRSRRELLDDGDRAAIRELCGDAARALGFQ